METLALTITGPDDVMLSDSLLQVAADMAAEVDSAGTISDIESDDTRTLIVRDDPTTLARPTARPGVPAGHAEELEVLETLRDLCAAARAAFPPAATIVLDDSDQGDGAVLRALRDAFGNDIPGTELWDDGDEYARLLHANRNYVWKPFLAAGSSLDRHNPCSCIIAIDPVLALG